MLIDDDDTDNFINSRVITSAHFSKTVLTENGAEDALEYLKKNSEATDKLPQIIFLDLALNGMDGFEFLNAYDKLQDKIKKSCKVVVLSNFIGENDISRLSGNPNILKYLENPLNTEALKAIE